MGKPLTCSVGAFFYRIGFLLFLLLLRFFWIGWRLVHMGEGLFLSTHLFQVANRRIHHRNLLEFLVFRSLVVFFLFRSLLGCFVSFLVLRILLVV